MSNGVTFEILNIILRNFYRCWDLNKKWPLQKFHENRFRIDGEIAENHAILVNLTASIVLTVCIFCYYL